MHVGIGGAGGVGGRSYRSSISESHTAVPAPLPLPALPGAAGARLGACPGFGMGRLMLCPGNPLDPGEEPVIRCPCQPFPAVPVPGSVPAPGLGFSVRKPPRIPQSDRMLRSPCPVCGSLQPGSQLAPCRTAGQKWGRSLSPYIQRILLPGFTGP